MDTFKVDAMVRGYHEYEKIWKAAKGEKLECIRELGNRVDVFAVAVIKSEKTVGHLPRKISSICSIFLRHGGKITCEVSGSRRHSKDLTQGGMEVPCKLVFVGSSKDVAKAKKLIESSALSQACSINATSHHQKDPAEVSGPPAKKTPLTLVNASCCILGSDEQDEVIMGERLTDLHVNFAQELLKSQFPSLMGLESTLLVTKECFKTAGTTNKLQILFCRGNHWITVSNIKTTGVHVYDSIYSTIDKATEKLIYRLFTDSTKSTPPMITVYRFQKQRGSNDCGLFAIAVATAIAQGQDPAKIKFIQAAMRLHFVSCMKNNKLEMFPSAADC